MERRAAMKTSQMQTANRRRRGAISFWIAAAAIAIVVTTQAIHADDVQPAARAVQLSYVEGQVRVTQGNQVVTEGATVNMPLFEGMQVSTAQDGRAEIQFEDGSVARLSPNTTITLSVLRGEGTNGDAEMVLNGGLAYFEFQGSAQPGQFAVHFGDSSVVPSGNAVIRIRMDAPPGDMAILSGNADLSRGNGAMQLAMHGGESVTLYAGDINRYDLNESIDPDSWDAWNTDRDQAMSTEEAAYTAAPPSQSGPESGSPAWSDLDANGSWYDIPGQGYMWSPFEASNPGWDPYGCGNWMAYPQFGYTFVPCDNWGFLPYSCGSWGFFNDFGWGWSPGVGGCNPWWNSLGYYPGPRFRGSFPPGYRIPHRPVMPRGGASPGHPFPVIAVNRTPVSGGTPFPGRERNQPVTIAGNTVAPIRPVVARGGGNRAPTGIARPGFTIFDGSARSDSSMVRPAYASPNPGGSSSGYRGSPSAYSPGNSRGSVPAHPSSSGPAHSSSGGSSHASSGGASHASSGGGGGGGGAHAGGGGGGGGAHK
jgi:FecR protein